jgi:hypothetical protein
MNLWNYNFGHFCGCETWSVMLREQHKLRSFEERERNQDNVIGGCRKVHKEKFHNLHIRQT